MAAAVAQLETMQSIKGTRWGPSDGESSTINGWLNFVGTTFPEMAGYCNGETHIGYFSWCGCTVGYCIAKAGSRPVYTKGLDTKSFLWAQAWLDWGTPVNDPQPGDVLVFDFGHGDHHVTLFDHDNGNGTWGCLGGNQDHQVMVSNFRRSQCIGIRRPPTESAVQTANTTSNRPEVKLDDVGSVVSELQHLLGVTVDGEFGPETDAAVRAYQATHGLDVDGDVGDETWAALLSGKPATALGAVISADTVNKIVQVAAASDLARHSWSSRGAAPPGYIKGMAVAFGNVYAKWKKGDSAVAVMAAPNSGDSGRDALAWYDGHFAALGMRNGQHEAQNGDVLRHLFVLLTGLGMRESSGRCCEGRDLSASNTTADTAEAGLFQQSWNSRFASPELPKLFSEYSAKPQGFHAIFSEGVTPHGGDLDDFGIGDGATFQALCKSCPAFAVEAAAVGLRTIRTHWGPIDRQEAELRPEADRLFQQVQDIVDSAVVVSTITATTTTAAATTQSVLAEILKRLRELDKVTTVTAAPGPSPTPVTTAPVTAAPVIATPVATTLPADLARIEMDIARLGQVAATFSQIANQVGQIPTAGLPPQVAQAEQTITRLGQIAGTLSQYASAIAGQPGAAAGKTKPQLSPIDKVLGGEALVGLKTPLAIAGYALMWILQTLGAMGTATGDKATATGAVITALVSAFGALGVTAKFDRAFQALSTIAGILQKRAALVPPAATPAVLLGAGATATLVVLIGSVVWWKQDLLKDQYYRRTVMGPSPLTAELEKEKAAEPGSDFKECANGCPTMIVVPGGRFMMGSPEKEIGRSNSEGPQHEVTIARSFAVSRTEVTFAQWDACFAAAACTKVPDSTWGRDDRPVINVSWEDAKQYVAWLSRITGRDYRLLTEAEWEYSARVGSSARFAFGDAEEQLDQYAWYSKNSDGETQPVAKKKANAFGLHDMHGNVWEWCEDAWHDNYNGAPTDGSAWLKGGNDSRRVVRGGSWGFNAQDLRAAVRIEVTSGIRSSDLGFRLARTLNP